MTKTEKILGLLETIWKLNPRDSLGQILCRATSMEDYMFYAKDEIVIEELEQYLQEYKEANS